MTVETCMRLVDGMRPNGFSEAVKRRFLGEAEGKVRVELLGEEPDAVPAIDGNTPADTRRSDRRGLRAAHKEPRTGRNKHEKHIFGPSAKNICA